MDARELHDRPPVEYAAAFAEAEVADFDANPVVGAPFRQDACDVGCDCLEAQVEVKFRLTKKQVEEDKRARRLERNRESARQSRQRKKQYLELLETRAAELRAQLDAVRDTHCISADVTLTEQKARLVQGMEMLAAKPDRTPEEESQLADAALQLLDRYGPNCSERKAAREYHFDQLHKLLLSPHTRFVLWLVHQAAEPPAATSTEGIVYATFWKSFVGEVGLLSDQADKLRYDLATMLNGADLSREVWRLGVASSHLGRLRSAVGSRAAAAQSQLETLRCILHPAQLLRYFAWFESNQARVEASIEVSAALAASTSTSSFSSTASNISGRP